MGDYKLLEKNEPHFRGLAKFGFDKELLDWLEDKAEKEKMRKKRPML